MKGKYFFFTVLLFLFMSSYLPAFGRKENIVQVTGVVRLVGNANFPEIVISGAENEWYVAKEDMRLFNDLQHRTVIAQGIETITELKFANGLPAGKRRELKKIKIIEIK